MYSNFVTAAAGQSDVPYNVSGSDAEAISGVNANQVIQLNQTNATASHAIAPGSWEAGDVLTLTLNASPLSWNGTATRYIAPSILDGTNVLWSASELMPTYNNFGRTGSSRRPNFRVFDPRR